MVDANLLWLIGLSCSATWMTWIHWTGRFPGPVERDEQVVRTGWRSEGESSEQMSRSVWGEWGRLEEAGLTYALQRQRQVGRAAPTRGRKVQTGRALWSPSGCSGGGGGGGGRGVIFTKVRDKFPSWFSSSPEWDWRGVGGVFVRSQPGVWETEFIYSKISDLHLTGFNIIVWIPIFPRISPVERSYFCIAWCSWKGIFYHL